MDLIKKYLSKVQIHSLKHLAKDGVMIVQMRRAAVFAVGVFGVFREIIAKALHLTE